MSDEPDYFTSLIDEELALRLITIRGRKNMGHDADRSPEALAQARAALAKARDRAEQEQKQEQKSKKKVKAALPDWGAIVVSKDGSVVAHHSDPHSARSAIARAIEGGAKGPFHLYTFTASFVPSPKMMREITDNGTTDKEID